VTARSKAAISPDGKKLAMDLRDPQTQKRTLWVRDLSRGVSSRFTFGPSNNFAPVWSPDGIRIAFCSDGNGPPSLYEKASSGTGPEREPWSRGESLTSGDWSRDGRPTGVNRLTSKTGWDIWILPTDGKTQSFPFLAAALRHPPLDRGPALLKPPYCGNAAGGVSWKPSPSSALRNATRSFASCADKSSFCIFGSRCGFAIPPFT
jgi:dipeptidyl aminopeptidase/acylaminoacyl peptidase